MSQTKEIGEGYEFRYQGGDLDEVVATDVASFHLEYMNDGQVWMGLTLKSGELLHVFLWTKRNGKILGRAEKQ